MAPTRHVTTPIEPGDPYCLGCPNAYDEQTHLRCRWLVDPHSAGGRAVEGWCDEHQGAPAGMTWPVLRPCPGRDSHAPEPPGWIAGKFRVEHAERGELPERDVFVLVPERDPAARVALVAYSAATADTRLAAELDSWLTRCGPTGPPAPRREIGTRIAVWAAVLAGEVKGGRMTVETALQRIAGHALAAVSGRAPLPPEANPDDPA